MFRIPRCPVVLRCALIACVSASAAGAEQEIGSGAGKFAQLGTELRSPNVYRNAAGAPGPRYWQQRADYKIKVTLNEILRTITGSATVTYHNSSPDTLNFLWIQLDQNRFSEGSLARLSATSDTESGDRLGFNSLRQNHSYQDETYGYQIDHVSEAGGSELSYTIVDTMMRIELPKPLKPGKHFQFNINWQFNIIEEVALGGRGGYEKFQDNDTYIYFLAQWFPRMAAYTDYTGWQHKQFLGGGEFTLEFGDYDVSITVPSDHIVSATGALQNPKDVLSQVQRRRLADVNSDKPVFIVTPEEALSNEKSGTESTSTWRFRAENVRDFAWASSRKFIWDAMLHQQKGAENPTVLAMSFYPNEAQPIWSQYSTHAVVHTMGVYSRFTFDYPYPTAQSVNTWKSGGMEYPMISFNGGRPKPPEAVEKSEAPANLPADDESKIDDSSKQDSSTYSRVIKYDLIGVIIHEIGHSYFPMIINSDERQWTWMDEGFNTFLEYIAELEWEEGFTPWFSHGKTNVLDYIPEYMTGSNQVPIMTQSDSVLQLSNNAYTKPTAAFTVLRETVMGRELFDYAFKEYARRWKFKRPTPADFFRTMEDASAIDLDWFWRGWFYSTDHVDVAISGIREYKVKTGDPDVDYPLDREEHSITNPPPLMEERNRQEGIKTRLNRYPELADTYNKNDPFTVSNKDRNDYQDYLKSLEEWEVKALNRAVQEGRFVYFADFKNKGGLVTPLPLTITYADDSTRELMLPAEIWRRNAVNITRLFIETKRIRHIAIDERHQTGEADFSDNQFPPKIVASRLEIYKADEDKRNLMADMLVELKGDNSVKTGNVSGKNVPLEPVNDE